MKWHWIMLLVGLGLYTLVLIPGILTHANDGIVTMLAAAVIVIVAVFGFDTVHLEKRLAVLMIIGSLIMFTAGITLARPDHRHTPFLLFVPAAGLGLFGVRKLMENQEKND